MFAEWFGPGVITSERPIPALIDGCEQLVDDHISFQERAQVLEECRGAIIVHSPTKPILGGMPTISTTQTDAPGWITSAKAAVEVDKLGNYAPEVIQLGPIPVLDQAASSEPFAFTPSPPQSTHSIEVSAERIKDAPILKSIKNTSAPISVPDQSGSILTTVMQLNDMVFEIELIEDHQTIVIDRLYDRFHGKQRARVVIWSIPERVVLHEGIWYEPQEDRQNRVANSRYVANLSQTSNSVQIVIAPPSGSPLWSMISYRFRTFH